jgi:integrase
VFVRELEQRPRRAARVLHLLILTATRTNEVPFARPEEFDVDNRIWSIPGDRMKSGRPLRIPLCERAVEIVRGALPKAKYGYLFPGYKEGRPLSNMAILRFAFGLPEACVAATLRRQGNLVLSPPGSF